MDSKTIDDLPVKLVNSLLAWCASEHVDPALVRVFRTVLGTWVIKVNGLTKIWNDYVGRWL